MPLLPNGPPVPSPVQFRVSGPNPPVLRARADEVRVDGPQRPGHPLVHPPEDLQAADGRERAAVRVRQMADQQQLRQGQRPATVALKPGIHLEPHRAARRGQRHERAAVFGGHDGNGQGGTVAFFGVGGCGETGAELQVLVQQFLRVPGGHDRFLEGQLVLVDLHQLARGIRGDAQPSHRGHPLADRFHVRLVVSDQARQPGAAFPEPGVGAGVVLDQEAQRPASGMAGPDLPDLVQAAGGFVDLPVQVATEPVELTRPAGIPHEQGRGVKRPLRGADHGHLPGGVGQDLGLPGRGTPSLGQASPAWGLGWRSQPGTPLKCAPSRSVAARPVPPTGRSGRQA